MPVAQPISNGDHPLVKAFIAGLVSANEHDCIAKWIEKELLLMLVRLELTHSASNMCTDSTCQVRRPLPHDERDGRRARAIDVRTLREKLVEMPASGRAVLRMAPSVLALRRSPTAVWLRLPAVIANSEFFAVDRQFVVARITDATRSPHYISKLFVYSQRSQKTVHREVLCSHVPFACQSQRQLP